MTAKIHITDGKGTKNRALVTEAGELTVITSPFPPFARQKVKPFRQYMTDDGTTTGSNNMAVDGSITNVDFWVPASSSDDRYITQLSVLVGYTASGKPFQWADNTTLTNGHRLFYTSLAGEVDIHPFVTSNQEMFRLFNGMITSLWEVRHVNALNDYGYFIYMDLTKMLPPFGVKLDSGTNQKLVMTIRDLATAADSFNIIAYGFDRFE